MRAAVAPFLILLAMAAPGVAVGQTVDDLSARIEAQNAVIQQLLGRIETLEAAGAPETAAAVAISASDDAPAPPPVALLPVATAAIPRPASEWTASLHGRVDADVWLADEARSGSEIRRSRLTLDGGDRRSLAYVLSLEFAGGATTVLDAYLSIAAGERSAFRLGKQRVPFSLTGQTSENYAQLMERPVGLEPFIPGYAQGASILTRGDRWSMQAGVYSRAQAEGGDVSDDDLLVGGRLTWAPVLTADRFVHFGVAINQSRLASGGEVRLRQRPENHLAPFALDSGLTPADGQTRAGLEAAFGADAWGGLAEAVWTSIDRAVGGDPDYSGYAIETWWTLTGESRPYRVDGGVFNRLTPRRSVEGGGPGAWQIVGRISALDLDDDALEIGRMSAQALGLNWYLNGGARLMLNLSHSKTTTVLRQSEDTGVALRAHVDW